MSIRIHTHTGEHIALEPNSGDTLARTIFLGGLWYGVPLCSGLGKCGLCRVRYVNDTPMHTADEIKKLGDEAVAQGWRLACLHPSKSCDIELPEPIRSKPTKHTLADTTGNFSLAVDLGTTSIHWTALVDDVPVASGQELNPQTGLGSEVMSRLAVAATPEGRTVLRALILDRLTELVQTTAAMLVGSCTSLVISGNSVMTYILLGMKPDDLATAPYTLSYTGGDEQHLTTELPAVYIPPLLAPFVGADLSAGLTALEYGQTTDYPFLLADLGTNGEFILALSPNKRFCASVPMGPALEGVGLSFGRTASPGAITGFTLTPRGLEALYFDDTASERIGMTGTGYLSLVAILRKHGVVNESGQFCTGSTPLAAKLANKVTTIQGEPAFVINSTLHLPASDIEEILKVKAAFNLAMSALLNAADFGPAGLKKIYIAGALGEYVSLGDLETLGFLPAGCKNKAIKAGNSSLRGTEILTTSKQARQFAEALPDTMIQLDLTNDAGFGDEFIQRMRFSYVD
ncbi:(2Fe-2S)-binding protein [Pseudodesulfovibrio nedwellii]|uniref:(2Fe-2S)-binding protein n=1 Tax=Pseudodesulfovibrio nedwellii TaxID=2973072 RepID=A0ABN6S762_9BACT|nr:ASKHA domain-containing protein [Pseudodesulfovibrio nedwellii]BDQ38999.1 (2Fe-2S)-binding protein [Pseudodesulfovibrio nedwellii]